MDKYGTRNIFQGIEIIKLSQKSLKAVLKEFEGAKLPDNFDEDFDVYLLNNGYVVYNTPVFPMLFKSVDDLNKYIKYSMDLAQKEIDKGPNYPSLISNVEAYLDSFQTTTNLRLNFNDLHDLKKVDSYFNENYKLNKDFRIPDEQLFAVVGTFLIAHVDGGQWMNMKIDANRSMPIVMDNKQQIYNPIRIVEKEISYYLKHEGEIALYDNVEIELIQYKAIKKLGE